MGKHKFVNLIRRELAKSAAMLREAACGQLDCELALSHAENNLAFIARWIQTVTSKGLADDPVIPPSKRGPRKAEQAAEAKKGSK